MSTARAALPADLVGDLKVLRQKAERYISLRESKAPAKTIQAAENEMLRAAAILNEYIPQSAAGEGSGT